MKTLLASRSPRRIELLHKLIDKFDVYATDADEDYSEESPEGTAKEIAYRKLAVALSNNKGYDLIIASDTVVWLDGAYYGKPSDNADAARMLTALSGKTHIVYTAVVLWFDGESTSQVEASKVTFKALTPQAIAEYISTHNVLDKAGAYGIQDGALVESFIGSYDNIMGLPTERLAPIIKGFLSKMPKPRKKRKNV